MITPIIIIVGCLLVLIIVIKWTSEVRSFYQHIHHHPNAAYDLFCSDSKRWVVHEIASPELISDQLPSAKGLPQRNLLGPFQFRVPKLQNRMITVYGKSKDCLKILSQFDKELTIQDKEEQK